MLWDFDDTLVDSLPARAYALGRVFEDTNIRNVDPEAFLLSLDGRTLEASLAHQTKNSGWPSGLFERYRNVYWVEKAVTPRLYPGIEDVLDSLQQLGVLLGIVTSKPMSFDVEGVWGGVSAELADVGVTARFPVVVGLEDVSEPKPHPEGILRALERLGVTPDHALMVGDSGADIGAARAAGCWSCLATWGVPDGADRAKRLRPDLVAEAPRDVLSFVGWPPGPP